MKQILVNGEASSRIDILDRGLQYGDGLFETMRIIDGEIPLWRYHWRRLKHACSRLFIPAPEEHLLLQECQSLVANDTQAVLKIMLTRGVGDRGYAMPENPEPSRILILSDVPEYPDSYRRQGVKVYSCQTRLSLNPALAGLKHLNRLEQVLARNEWQGKEYQEGLLLDTNGCVIEGVMSNIFWANNDTLFTPELSACGVAGVMREFVMQLATENGISIKMGLWPISELFDAEEIFMTNSLIGVWPVSYILNKTFDVGPVTQQLQLLLQAKYAI